jgi:hopene-associated glycosyltransferase HpnB
VIVIDDGSTDGTADIARAAASGSARELEIVTAPPLPEGWTGKLWAVDNGLRRAKEIAPDAKYALLADADIALARDTLSRLVAKAEDENLALASLMARLDARGPWASFLIPAFIYFFQKLYPFPRANDPDDNMAAAAGGCMLARRDAIDGIGGIARIRHALIDDCAFAKAIKDLTPSTKIWIGLASDEAISLRDNRELSSIWNMVARTAYAQLHYSPLLLAGTVLGMALVYLAAPLIFLTAFWHWNLAALFYAAVACALMGYTYWPTLRLYGRAPWEAALQPIAAGLYTAMTISSALRHRRGEGGQWKGRTYSSSAVNQ